MQRAVALNKVKGKCFFKAFFFPFLVYPQYLQRIGVLFIYREDFLLYVNLQYFYNNKYLNQKCKGQRDPVNIQ